MGQRAISAMSLGPTAAALREMTPTRCRARHVVHRGSGRQEGLSSADAARFGVRDGGKVVVKSPFGEAQAVARVSPRVAEGTAFLSFHFPETGTNNLMSPVLDRLADCPEYKVTPVTVGPAHHLVPPRVG